MILDIRKDDIVCCGAYNAIGRVIDIFDERNDSVLVQFNNVRCEYWQPTDHCMSIVPNDTELTDHLGRTHEEIIRQYDKDDE